MFKVKPIYGCLFKCIPYPIGLEFHWGSFRSGPKWILRWWFKRSNSYVKPYKWWLVNNISYDSWEGNGMDDLFDQLWDA